MKTKKLRFKKETMANLTRLNQEEKMRIRGGGSGVTNYFMCDSSDCHGESANCDWPSENTTVFSGYCLP